MATRADLPTDDAALLVVGGVLIPLAVDPLGARRMAHRELARFRHFYYRRNMEKEIGDDEVIRGLAALAQTARLRAFRELVGAGPAGLTPSVLAERLALPAPTLSFHLKELLHAGLVTQQRDGRFLIYRAEFARINALLGYLTAHCCESAVCEINGDASRCRC